MGLYLGNIAETEETETGKGPQTIKFLLKGEFLGEFKFPRIYYNFLLRFFLWGDFLHFPVISHQLHTYTGLLIVSEIIGPGEKSI